MTDTEKNKHLKILSSFIDAQKVEKIQKVGVHKYYLSYPIEKSSGKKRWLDAPQDELKDLQEQILENILYNFTPHRSAVGFRPNIGLIEGPKRHLGCEVLLSLDFKDFFTSIKKDKVFKLFTWIGSRMVEEGLCSEWSSQCTNVLVYLTTYKGHLPQGAPTSPAISNLVTRPLDKELQRIATINKLTYTRYADDITFSSKDGGMDIMEIYPEVEAAIKSADLVLNSSKTRIQRPHQRMEVTGVVINDKLSVPKWKWRNFRAKLHNLKMSGEPVETIEYQKILGYAQWIKQLHPIRGERFLTEIGKLNLQT